MGMSLIQFLFALILPVVVATVGMGLVIAFVFRKAVESGMPIQRPGESEEEWTARLRDQIESDRAQTTPPGD